MFDFLSEKISSVFGALGGSTHITESVINKTIEGVRDGLLEADVPLAVADAFIAEVKKDALGKKVTKSLKPVEQLTKIVYDRLVHFLGGQGVSGVNVFQMPSMVMVMGLQGSGKTITLAKIAHQVLEQARKRGKTRRILLASVDFYRPAAVDQLEIMARQAGVDFYRAVSADVLGAAQEIQAYGVKHQYEMVLLDTAGRLHIDTDLMLEIQKIDKALKPKYKVLVLDAMTGQESLTIAQTFEEKIGFFGAILTKMDSDTRGGAAFAFRYMLKKPILFVGTGEKVADLEYLHPDRVASRMIGSGDVQSLLERAEEKIKVQDSERLYKNMVQGRMTLDDFAQQIEMVNKMGSLGSIMKYLPGAGNLKITPDALQKGEYEIKKFKAIISSMTLKERVFPKLIDGSRRQRIARGSGVTPQDVVLLLERFEQSQQFVKMFKKMSSLR